LFTYLLFNRMSIKKLVLSFSVLLLATLACNFIAATQTSPALPSTVIPELTVIVEPTSASGPTSAPVADADVERIPVELALTALQSGEAVIVDVRSAQQYAASPWTRSMPTQQV
jgi:hypothetical protein